MPHSIRKLREQGYVVKDMYKLNSPLISTNAGIIVLFVAYISISLLPLLSRIIDKTNFIDVNAVDFSEVNLAFLLVVSVYALYGLVDDLVDVGRFLKIILPISFGFPLISVLHPETLWIPYMGEINLHEDFLFGANLGDLFRVVVIPIYVMVVANLVNMHSGYNGLQSGLSVILLSVLLFKSWFEGELIHVLPAAAFLGSMVAFWFFNFYPSKVFEGNIGSLLFGSVIGSIIVIQQYWWFGFFILIPHTINFILWIIWLIMIRLDSSNYLESNGSHKKFGEISEAGYIRVPNRLTLKWIPNYYFKLNEKDSVIILYFFTFIFSILGLILY